MDSVLIIGAGAAGSVTAQKCAMNRDVFKKMHLASRRLASCEAVAKQLQDADRDLSGRCRQRRRDGEAVEEGQARPRHQHGAALPGPADHGRVPRSWRALHGHGQLRAARRGEVHLQVAVALPQEIQGRRHHGGPRLRLRSRPVEHLLRLCAGVPVRRNRDDRHHRLQRRQPRQVVRHQLQSGDQSARSHAARQILEGRQVDRHRSAVDLHA